MKRKSTLLILGALIFSSASFGQWIDHDSTFTSEGNYTSPGWPQGVTITIPAGVTVNSGNIGGNGSLELNGTLNVSGDVQVAQTFSVGQNASLTSSGQLTSIGAVIVGENAIISVNGFSPSLASGQTIELKNGAVFTVKNPCSINTGSLVLDEGSTFNANSGLNLSNSNNIISGNLNVAGSLQFNNSPNTINCPGKIITYDLVNNSGPAPIEGTGYIEVQNNFTSANKFTNSTGITLNVLGTTNGNIGDAAIGTESACAPSTLPVSIKDFQAVASSSGTLLSWITATEINNKQFIIERSSDATNYFPIATLQTQAAGGNSTQAIVYKFTDAAPLGGVNYYRLKQVDNNGKISYYNKTVSVTIDHAATILIYPNPVQSILHIAGAVSQNAVFVIVDVNGRQVLKSSKADISVSGLASGLYFIQLLNGHQTKPLGKFIKN